MDYDYQIPEDAILYLSEDRGIYIPCDFFTETDPSMLKWECDDTTKTWILEHCSNPDNENYWDAWIDAEYYVKVVEGDKLYSIYHDGDLWLIPDTVE